MTIKIQFDEGEVQTISGIQHDLVEISTALSVSAITLGNIQDQLSELTRAMQSIASKDGQVIEPEPPQDASKRFTSTGVGS